MPPLFVLEDPDGVLEVTDGVTRATRMGIKSPTPAELDIRMPNGAVNKTVKIELVQPAEIGVLDEAAPTSAPATVPVSSVTFVVPQAGAVGLPFVGQ